MKLSMVNSRWVISQYSPLPICYQAVLVNSRWLPLTLRSRSLAWGSLPSLAVPGQWLLRLDRKFPLGNLYLNRALSQMMKGRVGLAVKGGRLVDLLAARGLLNNQMAPRRAQIAPGLAFVCWGGVG